MNAKTILLLALCLTANNLSAATFGKFTYTDDGNSITITKYPTTASGTANIPATITGKPVTAIGADSFLNCTGLTSVTFPSSIKSIGGTAFYNCSGLTGLTLPTGLTSVGESAFTGCTGLTTVSIPAKLTSIGSAAFANINGLTAISVDGANPAYASVNGVLFNKTKTAILECPGGKHGNYVIPSTVTSIGSYAFLSCLGLNSVTLPPGVTSIGYGAFQYCEYLTMVNLPAGVTSIGDSAFYDCRSLPGVTLPSSLTSIGVEAFTDCIAFTGVTIPASLTSIGNAPFYGCTALQTITVDTGNPNYSSVAGVVFNKAKTSIILFPAGRNGSYAIPAGTTAVPAYAFQNIPGLNAVIIPLSVTTIGDGAFSRCGALASATFLGNAPTMGTKVFDSAAAGFTIHYVTGKSGFTSPKWLGYHALGAASAPEIDVQQPAGTSLADGSTTPIHFGTIKFGMTGTAKTFAIWNNGTSNLTDIQITGNGVNATDFMVSPLGKTTIEPGTVSNFKVTFKPTGTGTRNATIHIKSNDANENPFDIKLTGMGSP